MDTCFDTAKWQGDAAEAGTSFTVSAITSWLRDDAGCDPGEQQRGSNTARQHHSSLTIDGLFCEPHEPPKG